MSCFGFLMLDGSAKQAETDQLEEEENGDREKLCHAIHCSGGIIGMNMNMK